MRPACPLGNARAAPPPWGPPRRGRRRERYESWLRQPGGFALLARRGEQAVGFAVVTVEDGYDSWDAGERIGEVHDIALLPEARGGGVGGELLTRVASELAADGVEY